MSEFKTGEKIEYLYSVKAVWEKGIYQGRLLHDGKRVLHVVYSEKNENMIVDFVRKPKPKPKITVNGVEVNAPMSEYPKEYAKYFFGNYNIVGDDVWLKTSGCRIRFEAGIFDNREDCKAYHKALHAPVTKFLEENKK